MPVNVPDIATISLVEGIRARSEKETLALDHPGHSHEYIFGQKLAKFHWEVYEVLLDGHQNPYGDHNPHLDLAPRNHAKSTIGEAFALWKIGRNPLELVQFISSTLPLAKKRLNKVGNCIRFNEKYVQLFGNLYPEDPDFTWKTEEFEVRRDRAKVWSESAEERDPTVIAFGIETSVEGGRATLQVFDDIVTVVNTRSEATRLVVREKYWMSFDPMLVPKGQKVIFGTRYHYNDLYAELIQKYDIERLYVGMYESGEADADLVDRIAKGEDV